MSALQWNILLAFLGPVVGGLFGYCVGWYVLGPIWYVMGWHARPSKVQAVVAPEGLPVPVNIRVEDAGRYDPYRTAAPPVSMDTDKPEPMGLPGHFWVEECSCGQGHWEQRSIITAGNENFIRSDQ